MYAVASPGGRSNWTMPEPDSRNHDHAGDSSKAAQYAVGPVTTAELALPADVTNEVVFGRVVQGTKCGGLFPPPQAGLLIDDVRVE